MNYATFKSQMLRMLKDYFGENADISITPLTKNNDIRLDGLIIQENSVNITPALYLNYYYEDYRNGDSMEQILSHILSDYGKHKSRQNPDLSFFTRYDQIKYHIVLKLIHYQSNRELLKQAPHFRFLDLAIVFSCLLLDTPNGNATILILNHHMEYWKVKKEQLLDAAKINTPALLPFKIHPLEKLLNSVMQETQEIPPGEWKELPALYVLSNCSNLFGATGMLFPEYIKDFAKEMDCDFYILPSSIHEVLLLPAEKRIEPDDLRHIICQVNKNHLRKEEILSDHPYYFSKNTGEISIL